LGSSIESRGKNSNSSSGGAGSAGSLDLLSKAADKETAVREKWEREGRSKVLHKEGSYEEWKE